MSPQNVLLVLMQSTRELLLVRAVSLQHCPLVGAPCVPGAQTSSAAEDVISILPMISPEMSLGLCGQQLLKDSSVMIVL